MSIKTQRLDFTQRIAEKEKRAKGIPTKTSERFARSMAIRSAIRTRMLAALLEEVEKERKSVV